MKAIIPVWAWPVTFFQVHGTMCCYRMRASYENNPMLRESRCYQARTLSEANVLLVWGSLTKKLSAALCDQIDTMISNRCIIHLRGCESRIDNHASSSSLANVLPVNWVLSSCTFETTEIRALVTEVRQCLRA